MQVQECARTDVKHLLHTTVFIEHHHASPIYIHFNPLQPQFIELEVNQ